MSKKKKIIPKTQAEKNDKLPPIINPNHEIASSKHTNELKWLALSIIIGYCYAVYCVGYGFIHNISNLSYLNGDFLQHFLGWDLLRYDTWHWPLTATDRIRYPIPTAIVYTDSFPLLAILLKSISTILPKIFIFQGFEYVLNCTLQFYFASLIFRTLRKDIVLTLIGSLFCLFSSIMLNRMSGHDTLTSHWLILASLFLILKPQSDIKTSDLYVQLALLFIALGTHAYIFFMIFILSFAWIYKLVYINKLSATTAIKYAALITLVSGISYWFYGYLVLDGSTGAGSFGDSSMNLNALLNPDLTGSVFLPSLPLISNAQGEGYQYLGFGVIIGIIILIICHIRSIPKLQTIVPAKYIGLIIACIIFLLISLSTVITFGNHVLLSYTNIFDNTFFMAIFRAFRSSGRLFWPVHYLIIIFVILKCYDLFRLKNKNITRGILILLLALQIIDLNPLRNVISSRISNNLNRGAWNSDLNNSMWYNLNQYKHLFILMNAMSEINGYPMYFKFGMVAALNNLTTNMFYVARGSNNQAYVAMNNFMRGQLEKDSIYIVDPRILTQMDPQITATINCSNIDNYTVCQNK